MATAQNARIELMDDKNRPSWFQYPEPFLRLVETGLVLFRPWTLLDGQFSASRMAGLKQRFPGRDLFPFALRTDCDDVACWEKGTPDKVVVVHDFADPGWERVAVFEKFWDWFRSAIEGFIDFEP
jgi:hypothetical protein